MGGPIWPDAQGPLLDSAMPEFRGIFGTEESAVREVRFSCMTC